MVSRLRIGELLVDAGLLTRAQLEQALHEQNVQGAGGKRLGQLIVSMQFVNEVQLARVLSQQLAVPWVSLSHIDFSRALLAMVPHEMAEKYCVIPVYVRRERRDVDTLYLAMDDPTHDEALRVVSETVSMPVRPMIAPPSDIRAAIARNYGPPKEIEREPLSELFPLPLVKKPATVKDASMFVALEPSPTMAAQSTSSKSEPSAEVPPESRPTVVGHTAIELSINEGALGPNAQATIPVAVPSVVPTAEFPALQRPGPKTVLMGSPDSSEVKPAKPPPVPMRAKMIDGTLPTPAYPVDRALIEAARPSIEPPTPALEPKVPQLVTVDSLKAVDAKVVDSAVAARGAVPTPARGVTTPSQSQEPSRGLAMVALTLLDGTRLALPANRARTGHLHRSRDQKTTGEPVRDARAIIDLLKAQSEHLSPAERERKTESILAALLTVLLRKGVVEEHELLAALQADGKS